MLYSLLFFDSDVDVIRFSDLDVELVDVAGKVPEDDKVTILDEVVL